MLNPAHWLKTLSSIASVAQCRIQGRDASLDEGYGRLSELFSSTREREGTVWWVGNGGSCAMCAHLAQDALNKLRVRSQVLSEPSLMTCMANDFGYEHVYDRPLGRLARPGDCLVAISSSGNSQNIVNCLDYALEAGLAVVTVSAFAPTNTLWNRACDVALYLPWSLYGLVEVGHEALLHAAIECQFLAENDNQGSSNE
ncbi:SIS domain-containing protein [Pseudodesulfovibrio sp.]|uniref:SIS domain-containing protein n=1 Tax=Pseudodesulfovibrio sp. TaxID=2035812 RepID=UPI00260FAD9F|nr:SIS domain-containing protein [Pseudodesulfovibrio sp.]MDD3313176.1 SIS domain-containing protein [Pseudodesulfovibrio sp.]